MERLPIFVYGTLKPGSAAYQRLLAAFVAQSYPARVDGAALYSDGVYPYLVCEPDLLADGDYVQGCLLLLQQATYRRTLARLDRYEDYRPGDPDRLYERCGLLAQAGEREIRVWTYSAGPRILRAARAKLLARVPGDAWPI